MRAPERSDQRRQDLGTDDLACRDAHGPSIDPGPGRSGTLERGRRRCHEPCVRQQLVCRLRRQQAACRACEQFRAQLRLELTHMPPQRGLRQPQRTRRARQAAMVGHSQERAQQGPVDGIHSHAKMYT